MAVVRYDSADERSVVNAAPLRHTLPGEQVALSANEYNVIGQAERVIVAERALTPWRCRELMFMSHTRSRAKY